MILTLTLRTSPPRQIDEILQNHTEIVFAAPPPAEAHHCGGLSETGGLGLGSLRKEMGARTPGSMMRRG